MMVLAILKLKILMNVYTPVVVMYPVEKTDAYKDVAHVNAHKCVSVLLIVMTTPFVKLVVDLNNVKKLAKIPIASKI